MARIRTIKPEFPQSESMGRVSRDSRYFFIMLWTICDDSGRCRGNSRILASLLYPYDNDVTHDIDIWINELEHEQCLVRYIIDGNTYIEILNWLKHQKIDKPTASKLPAFVESSRILSTNSRDVPTNSPGKGKEGKGKEGSRIRESVNDHLTFLQKTYPFANIEAEILEMEAKYENTNLGVDPYIYVSRWFKNLKAPAEISAPDTSYINNPAFNPDNY